VRCHLLNPFRDTGNSSGHCSFSVTVLSDQLDSALRRDDIKGAADSSRYNIGSLMAVQGDCQYVKVVKNIVVTKGQSKIQVGRALLRADIEGNCRCSALGKELR
jgi:hypothetical protein